MAHQIDRTAARALVEAGYMPLSHYVELFGDTVPCGAELPGELPHVPARDARAQRPNADRSRPSGGSGERPTRRA